jgi:hypothetical protein
LDFGLTAYVPYRTSDAALRFERFNLVMKNLSRRILSRSESRLAQLIRFRWTEELERGVSVATMANIVTPDGQKSIEASDCKSSPLILAQGSAEALK